MLPKVGGRLLAQAIRVCGRRDAPPTQFEVQNVGGLGAAERARYFLQLYDVYGQYMQRLRTGVDDCRTYVTAIQSVIASRSQGIVSSLADRVKQGGGPVTAPLSTEEFWLGFQEPQAAVCRADIDALSLFE